MVVQNINSLGSRSGMSPARLEHQKPIKFAQAERLGIQRATGTAAHEPAPPTNVVPDPIDGSAVDEGADGNQKGVLRLLEAGHFQGVADVRLRINFFDELSQTASARAADVAEDAGAALASEIGSSVQDLFGPMLADDQQAAALEELLSSFASAVESATHSTEDAVTLDPATIAEAIQGAYQTLAAELQSLFQAPPGDATASSPVDTTQPSLESTEPVTPTGTESADATELIVNAEAEPVSTPEPVVSPATEPIEQDPLLAALDLLKAAFDESLAELSALLDDAMRLPDPTSPKNGNGGAYDKFLAMYDALRGLPGELNTIA